MQIDFGQETTIFDRYNLPFTIRAQLTHLCDHGFGLGDSEETRSYISKWAEENLIPYACKSAHNRKLALEALDYLLTLNKNLKGRPRIRALCKDINEMQKRLSQYVNLTEK